MGSCNPNVTKDQAVLVSHPLGKTAIRTVVWNCTTVFMWGSEVSVPDMNRFKTLRIDSNRGTEYRLLGCRGLSL